MPRVQKKGNSRGASKRSAPGYPKNRPSRTGNPSGPGRSNAPPKKK